MTSSPLQWLAVGVIVILAVIFCIRRAVKPRRGCDCSPDTDHPCPLNPKSSCRDCHNKPNKTNKADSPSS